MDIVKGNIWEYCDEGYDIVITTNIGWNTNRDAIMGAGIAKEAADRVSWIKPLYGYLCQTLREYTPVIKIPPSPYILFPTKELNKQDPRLSWQSNSTLDLITKSSAQLANLSLDRDWKVVLPLVGCANGRLTRDKVLPILQTYLDSRFTLVEK